MVRSHVLPRLFAFALVGTVIACVGSCLVGQKVSAEPSVPRERYSDDGRVDPTDIPAPRPTPINQAPKVQGNGCNGYIAGYGYPVTNGFPVIQGSGCNGYVAGQSGGCNGFNAGQRTYQSNGCNGGSGGHVGLGLSQRREERVESRRGRRHHQSITVEYAAQPDCVSYVTYPAPTVPPPELPGRPAATSAPAAQAAAPPQLRIVGYQQVCMGNNCNQFQPIWGY